MALTANKYGWVFILAVLALTLTVVIVSRADKEVDAGDLEEVRPFRQFDLGSPGLDVVWSSDNRMIGAISGAIFGGGTKISFREVLSGIEIGAFKRKYFTTTPIALTADDRHVLLSAEDDQPGDTAAVSIYDLSNGEVTHQIPGPNPNKGPGYNRAQLFSYSPNKKWLAVVADIRPGTPVTLYDSSDWKPFRTLSVSECQSASNFDPGSACNVDPPGGDGFGFERASRSDRKSLTQRRARSIRLVG